MNYIRLKSGLDPLQIADRLKHKPQIMELQLFVEDLKNPEQTIKTIRSLKAQGIRVYLHHPMKYNGHFLDIMSSNPFVRVYYDWSCEQLAHICRKEDVLCVVHVHYSQSECSDYEDTYLRKKVKNRIEQLLSTSGGYFLWENTVEGIFSHANPYLFEEIVEPLNLPLCLDVSHSFISVKGNNRKLQEILHRFQDYVPYFHIVDSMGITHDSLPLGDGKIDWKGVVPFVVGKDFVLEIGLEDYYDCGPMVQSAAFFEKKINHLLSTTNP
jgi:hypothetical protein